MLVVGMPCDWHAEISGSTAPVNSYLLVVITVRAMIDAKNCVDVLFPVIA